MHPVLLYVIVVTASLLSAPAWAQGLGVIRVKPNADVPLAAPQPMVPGSGSAEATAAHEAMWFDLKASGYFAMQDPKGYLEKAAGIEPGTFQYRSWSDIGTAILVKTRIYGAGDAQCDPTLMCADLRVYHVPSEQQVADRRFKGSPAAARYLGHYMANHVLKVITGTRGYFGTRLAAVNTRTGNKEVYVLDADGNGVQPVTRNGAINLSPAWSPDGASIAWTSYKRGNPDLYLKNLRTGRTRVLSNQPGVNTSPAFSPDGKTLAMSRSVSGDADIYLINVANGSTLRQVTKGGGIDVSPGFSPDGSTLVFASERSGGSQIYRMPVGGSAASAKRLTFRGDFNVDPVISPNGESFAFVGRSQGGFDIYVGSLSDRRIVRLTQRQGDNEDPTWSPDSRYLVFSSTRSGQSDLWLSTADGRHQTRITTGGGWSQPVWIPMKAE